MGSPLKEYLYELSIMELAHEPPFLSEEYEYEVVGDTIYYYWAKNLNGSYDFNNTFKIPPPVVYDSSVKFEINGRRVTEDEFITLDDGTFKRLNKIVETGYVTTSFPYLLENSSWSKSYDRKELYESMLRKFGLDIGNIPFPEIVNSLYSYNRALLAQIERQLNMLKHFIEEMASILKVYFYELESSDLETVKIQSALENIDMIFVGQIVPGEWSKDVSLNTLKINSSNKRLNHIESSSLEAIKALLKKRDKFIEVAVELSGKLHTSEYMLEQLLLKDSVSTIKEFLYDSAPNPYEIAKEMYSGAKSHKYSVETTGQAMAITRDYIIENNVTTLWGKVSSIVNQILKKDISGIPEDIDKKTIRNWIKKYAAAYGISTSNPHSVS